jgi:ABC-type multidrug transport system fused ATPase/permease subunit
VTTETDLRTNTDSIRAQTPSKRLVVVAKNDAEDEKRPLEFALLKRLFSYAMPYRRRLYLLIGLVLLRGLQLPLIAWTMGAVIAGPITRGDIPAIFWGAAGYFALCLFTDLTFHFRHRNALELGEAVVHDLRRAVFDKLMAMPMGFFTRTRLGRILSRMTSDIESVRSGVQDVFFVSTVQGGQAIIAALIMAWLEPQLFAIVLCLAPILAIINNHFRRRMSRHTRIVQESFSRVTATLAESVNGIRVTQGFSRQDVNAGLFRSLADDHARYNMNMARTSATFLPLLDLNSQAFIAALLAVGGWRVISGHGELPDLIQFFFLANFFFGPIGVIGNQYNQAMTAMAGCERIFRLLDSEPDWKEPDDVTETTAALSGRVTFEDVSFSYDLKHQVLDRVSFNVEPGQTIALVGHTGCGKSTVVSLIAKLWPPDSGRILLDDVDLTGIAGASLRRHMGIVQQVNFLFTGSVLDNIRFAKPEATAEEILTAAESLGVRDIIESLPEGLNTVVGEKGTGISLGQRQVICFCRALIANPRILILDEATASIDTLTEARLQEALKRLLRGRTSFVIAHRLSTVREADQVLVMERGRLIERGRYDELVERGGRFAQLHKRFESASSGTANDVE